MAGGNRNRGGDQPLLPEGEPLVPPTTEIIADLTIGDDGPSTAPEAPVEDLTPVEPEPEPDVVVEPEPEGAPDPEPEAPVAEVEHPEGSVTFICDQWAGVKIFGSSIKFENHLFTTSDEGQIARLDAWEHARREG